MGCTSSEIGGETGYVYECTVAGTVLAFEDCLLVQGRAFRSEISHDGLPLGFGIYIRNVSFPLPYLHLVVRFPVPFAQHIVAVRYHRQSRNPLPTGPPAAAAAA